MSRGGAGPASTTGAWRICVDTGGTFTDAVGIDPLGRIHHAKVLSSGTLRAVVEPAWSGCAGRVRQQWCAAEPVIIGMSCRAADDAEGGARRVTGFEAATSTLTLDASAAWSPGTIIELSVDEEAPVLAARVLTGTPPGGALPPMEMRLATTRGTNALLTRRGGRVAVFVTRGLGDLLEIGTQQRPELFALDIRKPAPLHECVVEVPERTSARGEVLRDLDVEHLREEALRLVASGVRCAAVALLHADRFPDHERRLAGVLREAGFEHVACSHESAMIKLLPRAQTAVVDAYLAPVMRRYLDRVGAAMGGPARAGRLLVLTSAGSLVDAGAFRARDGLLSGPAGGVVGARRAARRAGIDRAVSFDMGGTSTDVARIDEHESLVFEHAVGDAHLVAPAVGVETVAAGGGSICGFDGVRLFVGPASAGAAPGPACYGAGGPLTLTDVNLLLGRLDPARFPIPIVIAAAEAALERVRREMTAVLGPALAPPRERLLEGFLRIAAERMAGAVRRVSARQGYDPRGYALVAFGGAGGQHACDVASLLGMRRVVIPAGAGVLSAEGLRAAGIERMAERQILRAMDEIEPSLVSVVSELEESARVRVMQAAGGGADMRARVRLVGALRMRGQEATVEVVFAPGERLGPLFQARYQEIYGHAPEGRGIELVWVRAIATMEAPPDEPRGVAARPRTGAGRQRRRVCFTGTWCDAVVVERAELDDALEGPALILEDHGVCVTPPGWVARNDPSGAIMLEHRGGEVAGARDDEIALEVFTSRVESIAREMGEALRRTAVSTNVKERLDYSCAVLDAAGELIVNAPHVPVHLGSLGLCVRTVRDVIEMLPGDVVVTNHPALGGSHLPDVTVITPIHDAAGTLIGYAASRAHHAEIGGTRPGSMPPGACRLEEEGVVIHPMHLVRKEGARYGEVERVLREAAHPSRAVGDNLADMRAAGAANQRAAGALRELAASMGTERVAAFFERIKERGAEAAARALGTIPSGVHGAEERMDDGSVLRVRITIEGGAASIDFTGSSPVHAGNLNATPAIVRSAVIYVLRLLVKDAIPLNEGLMRRVRLDVPPGMLNPDFSKSPAVAGGNVETSQRLVDTLLKALGVAACSQGTMNNLIFGPSRGDAPGYYETICGGAGGTAAGPGADAVHTHMTNTRITDPEILETRFPVRLEMFGVRRGSGGRGTHRGGDGAVRAITFLEPTSLSMITQHRIAGPYGMAGGEAGKPGRQRVVRTTGEVLTLGPTAGCELAAGDTLIIETPGGGGWGPVG